MRRGPTTAWKGKVNGDVVGVIQPANPNDTHVAGDALVNVRGAQRLHCANSVTRPGSHSEPGFEPGFQS